MSKQIMTVKVGSFIEYCFGYGWKEAEKQEIKTRSEM